MRIKSIQGDKEKQGRIHYEFDMDSQPIGEGGMGVVYRGVKIDENTGIKTDVAIKVLHEGLLDEVYARAEREASIQIKHTNLIEMYGLISEFEVDRYGVRRTRHYVISELLLGVDLSDLLTGKFDNSDGNENVYAKTVYSKYLKDRKSAAIEIIRNISSGVLALHDAGYIHRDIDPSNIMVTQEGAIKLIDFGIAKNINTLGTHDRLTTSAGKFMGKAEYASPELVLGDVKNHNYTTDRYALGILLFRLIVGKLPFNGPQYEVQQKQLKSKLPISLIEDVGLSKVVKKATEKTQASRYATVAEFRVAIDAASKKNRKKMSSWLYIAIVAAIIAVICGASWSYFLKSDPEPIVSVQNTVRDRFNNALSLLNGDNPETVKDGFALMNELANENYDSAKVELALTYFPYLEASNIADTLSHPILKRRYYLNLTSKNDADSVIKYLQALDNIPPEASYILGCTYFEKSADEQQALTMFHQAKYSLDKEAEVGHGYDSASLKKLLINNISALQDTN